MAELTEQQKHLQSVLEQQQTLVSEINTLEAQARQKREMAVKLQGIVEYLGGIGVELPKEEEAAAEAPAPAANTEVATPPAPAPTAPSTGTAGLAS
tara:strand:- start:175 stop:462 length:288 start_codon:yes stop_codon:yes gene_type:complete